MSSNRQTSLAESLRNARRSGTPSSTPPSNSHSSTPGASRVRRIVTTASLRSRPSSLRASPSPSDFFNDPSVLPSTPVEEGREDEYLEQLSYSFTYSTDVVTILRPGGYNPKNGFTLDNETADTDFSALLSALRHVLYPVSFSEFSKILDLEHDYDFYHVVLNEIVFTVLPVVLRGTALALYTEAALSHPGDGRYILQRLRYEVEGVPDSDTDRFWEKMRATIIDEDTDPAPQLTTIRTLGDKHARLNADYSEAKRVKDLWHILATSAKSSPFVTPLYVNVIRDLRSGTSFSFSTLCLRIRTVWREERAFATPTVSTAPPESDGGWKKTPTFNTMSYDRKPPHTVKLDGEWRAEPSHALILRWKGAGFPCILCFRLWGLTDSHPDTNSICPFTCREAYNPSRVPQLAPPAGTRPQPQEFAAALASLQGAGGAAAHALVVPPETSAPPASPSAFTFIVPDPPPHVPPSAEAVLISNPYLLYGLSMAAPWTHRSSTRPLTPSPSPCLVSLRRTMIGLPFARPRGSRPSRAGAQPTALFENQI
ncbi:hypothetical protein CYMTET_18103 [Cymbomonas tetramitiformis]|uniref:Uncharacterized protein n=1 Tax=Cymbomonas tetramitiformis TaxID=36881 RepID=A0AAE0G8Y0_9CHLO|nr:hypothetical protein CYMTET_18103 [Cymbomonas tetramitiformis]